MSAELAARDGEKRAGELLDWKRAQEARPYQLSVARTEKGFEDVRERNEAILCDLNRRGEEGGA